MRVLFAVLIALGAFMTVSSEADARKNSRAYAPYSYQGYGPPPPYRAYRPPQAYYGYQFQWERSDSSECIAARNLDPGGNYEDYPCWAQRAFAPKREN